jgi:hypothetical protein
MGSWESLSQNQTRYQQNNETAMKYNILILILLLYGSDGASLRGLTGEPCGECSLEVCEKNQCSNEHPYICVDGEAQGGCNNGSEYWPGSGACSKCCDLSTCGESTCEKECSDEVCLKETCSDDNPFVCTKGGTDSDATDPTYGCNPDKDYWLETDKNCMDCCDKRLCQIGREEPTCEKQCSDEVCLKETCSDDNPFVCTKGGTDSDATDPTYGCNPDKDYWLETDKNCMDCCDKRLCQIGREEPTCEKQCSDEVCLKETCSDDNPFVCTKGGTDSDATDPTYGCNPDKDYWLETDKNCVDCCDKRLCQIIRAEPPVPLPPETLPITAEPPVPLLPETLPLTAETPVPLPPETETTPCPKQSSKSHDSGHSHHRLRI